MDHFAIVIPVYNPTEHFRELLVRLRSVLASQPGQWLVVVVNDGSDHWPEIPQEGLPLIILHHQRNQGKGAALKTGFRYLAETAIPWTAVLTMDADLQHPPEEIPGFLRQFRNENPDMVLGCRNRSPRVMPLHRIASNYLTSLIISLLTGKKVRDSQSGFRLFRWGPLKSVLPVLEEDRFHLESEMLLRVASHGGKIKHVRIPTIYNSAPSAIRNWADTMNFIQLIMRFIWKRLWGHV